MACVRASLAAACSAVAIAALGCSEDSMPREPSSTRSEQAATSHDGPSGQADRGAEVSETDRSDPGYRAELARIERAKPEPPTPTDGAERLRHEKKVRGPGDGWYYVTPREREPTATAPLRGCVKRSPAGARRHRTANSSRESARDLPHRRRR